MIAGIEFFLMNGEIQFVERGSIYTFLELDVAIAGRLRNEMDNDPKVLRGLERLGVTDPTEQLKQFIFCRFGEFSKEADVTEDGEINAEYWDCGQRPCPADGLLCKLPSVPYGTLTPMEAGLIREVTSDNSNKIIAERLHRSPFTIETELRKVRQKIGCNTRTGISAFGARFKFV